MIKGVLTGFALLLFCFTAAAAQIGDCAAIPHDTKVAGAFSDMRETGEHAYGYTVMLWRAGTCLLGIFVAAEGLAADTPIGRLQAVKYDQKGGALSFSAKLTTGLMRLEGSKDLEPSRDLFTFDGHLKPTQLTGRVRHANLGNPSFKPIDKHVVLRASKEDAEVMRGATTYGEWRAKWEPILRVRGPKW